MTSTFSFSSFSSTSKIAACSCRALRDAAEDRAAWSSALESALPGVKALIEASPPDWALLEKKPKNEKKSSKTEFKHPKLLLAALCSGKEFSAQVFNRELDNEAEDFLLSCYDAKLSLERWRPSGEEEKKEEGKKKEPLLASSLERRRGRPLPQQRRRLLRLPPPPLASARAALA